MTIQRKISVPGCFSGEDLLTYLYRETGSDMIREIEHHFEACSECVDAFAELSFSRYSVYEWQQLEFAPLETPKFIIPTTRAPGTLVSYFNGLKGIFALGPRFAVAAAALALMTTFGIYLAVTPGPELATAEINSDPVPEVRSTVPPVTLESPDVNETVTKLAEPQVIREDSSLDGRTRSQHRPQASRPKRQLNSLTATATPTPAPPRLNDFQELSDDGLRLADLVADLDTRD
jgi:hypothetical protein